MTYKIVRKFFNEKFEDEEIRTNLSLKEARAVCNSKEASSNTCKLPVNVAITISKGDWFIAYCEE